MASTPAPPPTTLAEFAAEIRHLDDEWRLRTLLHEFQLRWLDTPTDRRKCLVTEEPTRIDERWDAFLAALAEHLCSADGLDPPGWTRSPDRHLRRFWYPATSSPTLRVEAIVHSPAAFESHGVLLAARELEVV